MKCTVPLIVVLIFCSGWGFFAHRKINRLAVFTLPVEMISFYKKNIRSIEEDAVNPTEDGTLFLRKPRDIILIWTTMAIAQCFTYQNIGKMPLINLVRTLFDHVEYCPGTSAGFIMN